MTMRGRLRATGGAAVLAALLLWPGGAHAVLLNLANRVDPVPPGGTAVLTIRVSGAGGGFATGCFNPLPECITGTATCSLGSPACVGNSFTGFFCTNAANEGASCGVGDPPVADASRCIPRTTGICNGGINAGFPCTSEIDCPGLTFVCVRAFNSGAPCGNGNVRDPTLCVANPEGFCASGPNFGEVCTVDEDCPPDEETEVEGIAVTLPIPPGMTFTSADKGGTSNGTSVNWVMPPLEPCGSAGTPQCPLLSANFIVDPSATIGSVIEAQATAEDSTSSTISNLLRLTIGTFRLNRLSLAYPKRDGKDHVTYRAFFTLDPGGEIDPPLEDFRFTVETGSTVITDLSLAAGEFQQSSGTAFTKFRTPDPGITTALLREVGPSHYLLRLRARKLDLGFLDELQVTVTLTIGDDIMSHQVPLAVRRGGLKFIDLDD
jgi:hypothetical protein